MRAGIGSGGEDVQVVVLLVGAEKGTRPAPILHMPVHEREDGTVVVSRRWQIPDSPRSAHQVRVGTDTVGSVVNAHRVLLQEDIDGRGFLQLSFALCTPRVTAGAVDASRDGIATVVWHLLLREYQKARFLAFLNPESDPFGASWQSTMAIITFGA